MNDESESKLRERESERGSRGADVATNCYRVQFRGELSGSCFIITAD